jgi:hypothetical protein
MATYLTVPDDYAGWNPTGRNFVLAGVAAGFVGLLSWLSLHGRLGSLQPSAASDKMFLFGLAWVGAGFFCLMAIAIFGCITLTLKSRGTVSVSDDGVTRTVGSRTHSLAWSDIQGLVPMPSGGVILVSLPGKADIFIPRFLDDYRACIAEIKDHGIQAIPSSSLSKKTKPTWKSRVRSFALLFFFIIALNPQHSHRVRIESLCVAIAFGAWMQQEEWSKPDRVAGRWSGILVTIGVFLLVLLRLVLTW